ncbi:MAG: dTMP kinase [Fidelibacterota bacterium]
MSSSIKGRFITFEGIDGCGKSTQVHMLGKVLESRGIAYIVVREPGGSDISEQIRNILLHSGGDELNERTEALLMTASRAQLTGEIIIPALEAGTWVLADRFADSTLAYQGGGRSLGLDWLRKLNDFATFNLQPDITFFVDVNPETGLKRQSVHPDRIERAGLAFQESVRSTYGALVKLFPRRLITIDGEKTIDAIHQNIISILENRKIL